MATLQAIGWAMLFTLPLSEDGIMITKETLSCSKFNYRLGTLYIEQEVFQDNEEVSGIVLVHEFKDKT